MKKFVLIISIFTFVLNAEVLYAQSLEEFELSKEWLAKIERITPTQGNGEIGKKKKILVFSLYTGFEHWTIPHSEAVVKIIGEKSKAFEVTSSTNINVFKKSNLKKYDAIVLNNNCSLGEKRNLFWDALKEDTKLTDSQRMNKAKKLENNLLKYVKKGHGLMVLHGAIVMQNNSTNFGDMVGGNFDYHPKQQKIKVNLVDSEHPLVQAFNGKGFYHYDEPYLFGNSYFDYNFRPLLYMETDKLEGLTTKPSDKIKYISWIKKYGKGRVFYCSPSHNAQSYDNPDILEFLLNGMQYVVGDLLCDDSPIGKPINDKAREKSK